MGEEIGQPGEHAHLDDRETAVLHQVLRKPEQIKPPDRIGNKARQKQSPGLRKSEEVNLAQLEYVPGYSLAPALTDQQKLLRSNRRVLLRNPIKEQPGCYPYETHR